MVKPTEAGMEALRRLTDPPLWQAPAASLPETARAASQYLFSCINPYAPKSPFDQLLVDGFDAEQIWQQIDLQSQPLLASLRRKVKYFEKNPKEIGVFQKVREGEKNVVEKKEKMLPNEVDDDDDIDMDELENGDEQEEGGEERESGDEERETEGEGGIEDKFLKIKELEKYLEEDEAREYRLDTKENKKKKKIDGRKNLIDEDGDADEEEGEEDDEEEVAEDEEDEDEDDELGVFNGGDDDDEEEDKLGNARYEDFFGSKNKKVSKRKSKLVDGSDEDLGSGDDQDKELVDKRKGGLSTHEKQLEKLRAEIEVMEKANLEPKAWTMQGEVTAASRPKNSALEVDLDFEHNLRPAPVITEEVTMSLEDMIKKRINEGRFDDIQRVSRLPSKAPTELKELDDNKSKRGLAEVYEEEYAQKTIPNAAPLSSSDGQKKEANDLFKRLCLKLDALSHFHFAPKPVVEDMSIQANVPALAMEEIAPMAVSDAAMLAPEEVFSGKGDIKEEAELTQAERKRRRANKKRKFKAEATKRVAKKAWDNTLRNHDDAKQE